MAAQPKKKISRVRSRTRRAHRARVLPKLAICANCKHPKPPHIACPECGFYGAKKILTTKTDKRIAKKLREEKRAEAQKAKGDKKPKTPKRSQGTSQKSTRKSDTKKDVPK